jgi:hypothetical protein
MRSSSWAACCGGGREPRVVRRAEGPRPVALGQPLGGLVAAPRPHGLRLRRLSGDVPGTHARGGTPRALRLRDGTPGRAGPPLGMPGIVHPRLPWAHARPDGFASDGQTAWLVEVKTARYLDEEDGWGDAGTDRIPVYYLAQVAWQMACTGADRVDVVAFGVGRDDYRVFVVRRDPVLIDSLERKVARWHRRHVEGGELPAVDGSDEARVALALRWPRHQGEALDLVADDETARLAHELASVRDALDHLEGRRTLLEQTLQARMGAARRLVDAHGMRLATWGDSRPRTSVDLDALRAALPEVAARFTKQGRPVRPFRLHRKAEDQAA